MKKYVIFAGVNGAGKSTLYNTLKLKNTLPRVNSDEIVRSFGDWRNVPGWFSKVIGSVNDNETVLD